MTAVAIEERKRRVPSHIIEMFEAQEATLLRYNFHSSMSMDRKMFQATITNPLLVRLIKYYENRDVSVDYGTHVPFTIVFPHASIPRETQLVLLSNNGIREEPIFNLRGPIVTRGTTRPDTPYLAIDIEPGTQLQGMSVNNCIKQMQEQRRGGCNLDEGIALIRDRSDILANHGIDLPGSLISDGLTPCIQYKNNSIVVSKRFPHLPSLPNQRFGSASFAGMIMLPASKPKAV